MMAALGLDVDDDGDQSSLVLTHDRDEYFRTFVPMTFGCLDFNLFCRSCVACADDQFASE